MSTCLEKFKKIRAMSTAALFTMFTAMFTAALFTIAKKWKQLKCPLTGEWTKRMWYRN